MIFTALLSIIAILLDGFAQLLPYSPDPFPEAVQTGWTTIATYAMQWDTLVPITEMFVALSIYITSWTVLLSWFFIKWIIQLVRGS